MKRVFPRLRARCEARGVTWGEVDLRWGITHAEAREGKVLPICLAEIDGCRPFFLGMLGDRYGWVPDGVEPALSERHPWLSDLPGRSVTEIEFRYGALAGPTAMPFFYLRDPSWIDTLPPGTDRSLYESVDDESRAKLAAIKDEVRTSYPDRVRVYTDPRHLGRLVEDDLSGLIESVFPPEPPTVEGQDAAAQEVLLRRLAAAHVGRDAERDRLDEHTRSDRGPACLVVAGDPGAGKTSLLASWVMRRRESTASEAVAVRPPGWSRRLVQALRPTRIPASGTFDLTHFAGASAGGVELAPVLRGCIDRLGARFGFRQEIPAGATGPAAGFANALSRAAAASRVLLVLDGLDRLDPRQQGLALAWLPEEWPRNVRVVVSAAPGPMLDELTRRGWPILKVGPLPSELRAGFVTGHLQRNYRRRLDAEYIREVTAHPAASNALCLRTLLDEMIASVGRIEDIPARLVDFRREADAAGLYVRIFERLEREHEQDRPGLVGEALSLLYAARHGLADQELMDLLGTPGNPLPSALWAPLALQLRPHALARPGLIGLATPSLRAAVDRRYLADSAGRARAHRRLADYFHRRPISPRVVEERPWHLAALGDWHGLASDLAKPEFLRVAWPRHKNEWKSYWLAVESMTPLRLPPLLADIVATPDAWPDAAWAAAQFLAETGHRDEALRLVKWRAGLPDGGRIDALDLAAALSVERGEWDEVLSLSEELSREATRADDVDARMNALLRVAMAHRRLGDRGRGLAMLAEAERLAAGRSSDRLADVLGQRALMLDDDGKLGGALGLCRRRATLYRQAGDMSGLAACLDHQGRLLGRTGRSGAALVAFAEEEAIARRLLDRAALQNCLGNTAEVLLARRRLGEVSARLDEREALCKALVDPRGLALTFLQKGEFFGTAMKQSGLGLDFVARADALVAAHRLDDIAVKAQAVRARVIAAGLR